ncbi:MAG TPA: cytochrome b/b6 domain-containing protein [Polyangiaceae bacterium]
MRRRIEVYSAFERFWHWLQAVTIIALLVTGLEIHWPEKVRLFGFMRATTLHEVLALFTIANAFLALFYHLATGAIRQFLPEPRDFFSLAVAQAKYYFYGVFKGERHPFEHGKAQKLNVLQQVTYLVLLNFVLPAQVVTGVLMWKAEDWAVLVERLGGLSMIATLHVLGAFFFFGFVVMHVYLTTTGRTPTAHLRAMTLGWDEVSDDPPAEKKETAP